MFGKAIVSLWFIVIFATFAVGQFSDFFSEGDACTTLEGGSGVCTKVSGCRPIINRVRRRKANHVVCGFDGLMQIVCCPLSGQDTIITTERSTTTTKQPIQTSAVVPNRITTNRISSLKCNEYKEFAYRKITYFNAIGLKYEHKILDCAFSSSISLIIDGVPAKVHEFPHMALIGSFNGTSFDWKCGGTLISEQFVLTAAHCIHPDYKHVRLGEHDLDRIDETTTMDLIAVESIKHPDYRVPSSYNDIALLKLDRIVKFSEVIRPACLPQASTVVTQRAIASGWGMTSYSGDRSHVLLKVLLQMFSQSECDPKHSRNRSLRRGIIEEYQVCAGSHNDTKDTCNGDSGGPLQIYHETHECTYTVIGVTSFGDICGTVDKPGVYTRVVTYLDWIESIVWPDSNPKQSVSG